jgi:hypothetical protein
MEKEVREGLVADVDG